MTIDERIRELVSAFKTKREQLDVADIKAVVDACVADLEEERNAAQHRAGELAADRDELAAKLDAATRECRVGWGEPCDGCEGKCNVVALLERVRSR